MKATYGEITHRDTIIDLGFHGSTIVDQVEPREIFKDPITDDGIKKSKKGLLQVYELPCPLGLPTNGDIGVKDQQTWEQEKQGLLTTVFKDGKLIKTTTLDEIRNKLNNN